VLESLNVADGSQTPDHHVGSAASNLASSVMRDDAAARQALQFEGRQMTLAEVLDRAARMSGRLKSLGISAGDRIALQVPNVPAFSFLYYAILRTGAIVVPMNPLLRPAETGYGLEHSGARMLIRFAPAALESEAVQVECLDIADPWMDDLATMPPDGTVSPVREDDTAVILFTSGTTGRQKGAELTHRGLRLNAEETRKLYALQPGEAVLGVLPLYHSYGQTCVLNAALSAGSRVVLQSRFDARRAVELIDAESIGIVAAVPTMIQGLLEASENDAAFRSVRMVQSGGAALPLATLREAEARFGCPVIEGYGLTETSPVATINTREPRPRGSIGLPIHGVEVTVVDGRGRELAADQVGEIVIRGHNVMKGYWGDPEATREAIDGEGWFHSGDLGRRDADGFLYVVGRIKDMINRGGLNVYPREIEEVLHEHPDVLEAAVIAVPDERLGEEVGAAIRLVRGGTDLGEIREYVKERVAPYKYPRFLWAVEELPKGPTGKILKRLIQMPAPVQKS
jgi:long-chain acyl-CoA synthetase